MSVLKLYFDSTVNQCSPSRGDLQRVCNYDENGVEYVTFEPVDYPALVASHGSVLDWSLDVLLKAGVDPRFPIHTSLTTRLEGASVVDKFVAEADVVLSSDSNQENV